MVLRLSAMQSSLLGGAESGTADSHCKQHRAYLFGLRVLQRQC